MWVTFKVKYFKHGRLDESWCRMCEAANLDPDDTDAVDVLIDSVLEKL